MSNVVLSRLNSEDMKSHLGVAAVIRNDKNEILIMDHVKFDCWTLPMGKVKEDETIEEGLKVELFEELDISIKEYELLTNEVRYYDRGEKEISVDCYVFEIRKYNGVIINKEAEKHRELKWISLDELLELDNVSDATRIYLNYVSGRI